MAEKKYHTTRGLLYSLQDYPESIHIFKNRELTMIDGNIAFNPFHVSNGKTIAEKPYTKLARFEMEWDNIDRKLSARYVIELTEGRLDAVRFGAEVYEGITGDGRSPIINCIEVTAQNPEMYSPVTVQFGHRSLIPAAIHRPLEDTVGFNRNFSSEVLISDHIDPMITEDVSQLISSTPGTIQNV